MKKILLSVVCLVAVAAAGFGGYTYYENQTMDPWLKANIAALATNEGLSTTEHPTVGPAGSNWKDVTFACVKVVSTGGEVTILGFGVKWDGTGITTHYNYKGCGYGSGYCLSSAGCH